MGLDVKAHIPTWAGTRMISNVASSMGYKAELRRPEAVDGMEQIAIYEGEALLMTVTLFHGFGVFGSNLISSSSRECTIQFFDEVVSRFGGILQPQDSTDVCEIREGLYHEGDAVFVLRWGIANGVIGGSKKADVQKAEEAFEEHINEKPTQI